MSYLVVSWVRLLVELKWSLKSLKLNGRHTVDSMKVLTIVFIGHVRYKAPRYWLRFVSSYLRQGTTTVNYLSQINPSPQLPAPSYNFKFCSRRPSKINAPGLIKALVEYCFKILRNRAKSLITIYSVFCLIDKSLCIASSSTSGSKSEFWHRHQNGLDA